MFWNRKKEKLERPSYSEMRSMIGEEMKEYYTQEMLTNTIYSIVRRLTKIEIQELVNEATNSDKIIDTLVERTLKKQLFIGLPK